MKKLILMLMAAFTISFTSCGNKNVQSSDANEAEAIVDTENATAELAAQLEAGDVNKFQEALNEAQIKISEMLRDNPEQAKAYLESVQIYLKENVEKINEVVGDNAIVATTVASLIETPAESIISNLQNAVNNVETAAEAKNEEMKQAAENQVNEAKQTVDNQVNAAKQAATDKANEAKQAAADKVNEGAQKVNKKVNEGADKLLKGAGLK